MTAQEHFRAYLHTHSYGLLPRQFPSYPQMGRAAAQHKPIKSGPSWCRGRTLLKAWWKAALGPAQLAVPQIKLTSARWQTSKRLAIQGKNTEPLLPESYTEPHLGSSRSRGKMGKKGGVRGGEMGTKCYVILIHSGWWHSLLYLKSWRGELISNFQYVKIWHITLVICTLLMKFWNTYPPAYTLWQLSQMFVVILKCQHFENNLTTIITLRSPLHFSILWGSSKNHAPPVAKKAAGRSGPQHLPQRTAFNPGSPVEPRGHRASSTPPTWLIRNVAWALGYVKAPPGSRKAALKCLYWDGASQMLTWKNIS